MATTMSRPGETSPDVRPTASLPVAAPEKEHPAAAGHAREKTGPPGATDRPAP
jgi:hypothetical protein